jgi:transcriptional regulator with XRE-family HTH domain
VPNPNPADPKPKRAASSPPKNLVGPQVARLRYQAGLSQAEFAAKCQRMGWDISRGIVAGIEGQVRCVTDFEFVQLARALGVPLAGLLPEALK